MDRKTETNGNHDADSTPSRTGVFATLKRWLIRFGPVGIFLFFLIKGLLWLTVPAVIIWWKSVGD